MRIVLASKSKARRELMKELGVPFECHTSNYEEDMGAYSEPGELAKFLALGKAEFLSSQFPLSLIIGADTFITIGHKKIGKPATINEAKKIIRAMSNGSVDVHSGLAVIKTGKKGEIVERVTNHIVTNITFSKINEKDINKIIASDEVLSTSGAFSIEGEGGKFVKNIQGDYHNVIGLPLFELKNMLQRFGVKLP